MRSAVLAIVMSACSGGGENPDGGTCATCITTLATGGSPFAIAVDSTSVYWTDSSTNTVQKVSTGGGAVTMLASGGAPRALALDSTSVYFVDGVDSSNTTFDVVKVPIAGGAPTTLMSTQSATDAPNGIAVDATSVYWTTLGDATKSVPSTITKVPIGGGAPTVLVSTSQMTIVDVKADASTVYYTARSGTAGAVFALPSAGGTPTTLATTQAIPFLLAIDGSSAYWTSSDNTIMKVPLAGGAATAVTSAPLPSGLVSDGSNVFFSEQGSGVAKVSVNGGTPTVIVTQGGLGVAVDSSSVYSLGAGVFKAPK